MSLTKSQKKASNKFYDTHKNDPSFKNKLKEKNKKAYLKKKQKNTNITTTSTTTTTTITNPIENQLLTQFIKCECGSYIRMGNAHQKIHEKTISHKIMSKNKSPILTTPTQTTIPITLIANNDENKQWIYLMRFLETQKIETNNYKNKSITTFKKYFVYKPGRSDQEYVEDRIKGYKSYKDKEIIYLEKVNNSRVTEKRILDIIKKQPNILKHHGDEWFICEDENLIKKIVKDNCY